MIRKPAYRYYCEFCGKSSGSGGHMSRHEKHCTMNPNRHCRMCDAMDREFGGHYRPTMQQLVAALGVGDEAGLDNLRELACGCPSCMLAAIRQSGLQRAPDCDEHGGDNGFRVDFNFKDEKTVFWAEINSSAHYREMRECGY